MPAALEWYRTQPYLIALLTSPGTPMLQNGQEFAEDYWLMEDDQGSGRRVIPRPLHWTFAEDSIGSNLLAIYKKLIEVRKAHGGLRSNNFYPAQWEDWQLQFNSAGYGIDVDKQVVIYHRWGQGDNGRLERFIIVLNFSDQPQTVDVPFADNGPWRDVLNDREVNVSNFELIQQTIEPYWGCVYYQ